MRTVPMRESSNDVSWRQLNDVVSSVLSSIEAQAPISRTDQAQAETSNRDLHRDPRPSRAGSRVEFEGV